MQPYVLERKSDNAVRPDKADDDWIHSFIDEQKSLNFVR